MVKIPLAQMCDALLSLINDAAFRAFDLLQWSEEDGKDYKKLVTALKQRFAPIEGEVELHYRLGQRRQLAPESLDNFTDALVDLTNRAYPDIDAVSRMGLARDRSSFSDGTCNEQR